MSGRPLKVLVVRGHVANPWELAPFAALDRDRFEVSYLQSGAAEFDTSLVSLPSRSVRTMRDVLPSGRLGDMLVRLPGDRYLKPREAFSGFDVVHAQELGFWYAAQAARLRDELGFRLVLTAWETLPFRDTYRNVRTRPYRRLTLAKADRFLATTERAAACLRLEGAPAERIGIAPPGVDLARFAVAPTASTHTVLSAGRLVWEKGHQDVLRAVAALRAGVVSSPVREPRVVVLGRGPEEARLRAYAEDLGIADLVDFRGFVGYEEMPSLYAAASCMVLGSIPVWSWEEQFGMVLAEAMAGGLPVIASRSGAIPEVCGEDAQYIGPGDWLGLASALADGPLSRPPDHRAPVDQARTKLYSVEAAAARLAAEYEALFA